MPVAVDYRDCPYIWKPEYFTMDEDALRSKLTTAHLVIGDVAETIPATVEQMAPIGFVSFDLDYYSSTVAAFGTLVIGWLIFERFDDRVAYYV